MNTNTTPHRNSPLSIDTVGLAKDLTAPVGNPQSAEAAKRAMSTTQTWKPSLDRRQSWDAQEYKHEMQKAMQTSTQPDSTVGFTERQ